MMTAIGLAAALCSGCASHDPSPHTGPPPGLETPHIVSGGSDSIGAIPGSAGAQYTYVFKQTLPANDRFVFQDRELSFSFRPSPTALYFQVENRTDRPVWIDWDRSTYLDSFGGSKQIANAETRWSQRYATLPPTQIAGLQRYSNYVFPIDYMVDPGGSQEQLHRPLFPEDKTAPQFVDREFGAVLAFRMGDGRNENYEFRFKVRSVLPR